MADMKRMPLHRVQRETGDGTLTPWLPDFEGRLDALLAAYEAQKTASKDYNPDHLPIDFGGHLAGSIRVSSFPGGVAGTMETFVAEIKKARGGFNTLGDRIDSLMGGAYTKTWYGDDFLAPVGSSNLVFDGDSLLLGTEIDPASHVWGGPAGLSWNSGAEYDHEFSAIANSGNYTGFSVSVSSPTTYSGGSVQIVDDPIVPGNKAYQLVATPGYGGGAVTMTRNLSGVSIYDAFVVETLVSAYGIARPYNYFTLGDGQKTLTLQFTTSGFTAAGSTYTHSGDTAWTDFNRVSIRKYGTDSWEIFVNDQPVLLIPYGAIAGTSLGNAYVQLAATGPNGGLFDNTISPLYREIHVTRFRINAKLSANVHLEAGNTVTLDAGRPFGYLTTRPVEIDDVSVQNLLTRVDWVGLGETHLDIRVAEDEAGPFTEWIPLGNGQPVPAELEDPDKRWYQLRARLVTPLEGIADQGDQLGPVAYGVPLLHGAEEAGGVVSFPFGGSYTMPGNGEVNYPGYPDAGWSYTNSGGWAGAVMPITGTLSQDGTRQVLRMAGAGFGIYGQTATLTGPEFTLSGDVHFVYYRSYSGLGQQATSTVYIRDAGTDAVLISAAVSSVGTWTDVTLPVGDTLIGRAVKVQFVSHFPEYIGANFDFRLDRVYQDSAMRYRTAVHQPGGTMVMAVRWKQRVGDPGDLTAEEAFPVIKVRTSDSPTSASYEEPTRLPRQITAAGSWVDVTYPLPFPAYGEYVTLEVEAANRAGAITALEVSDLAIDWVLPDQVTPSELHTAEIHYDRTYHLPEGEVTLRFDSTSEASRWKRLDADYGFPALTGNGKWLRRVMGGQRDPYVLLDAFEVYVPAEVPSPTANGLFPVSGFGADASVLFTTQLYNESDVDQVFTIPVASALGNTWELYRNRVSLGRSKESYTLVLPAGKWTRVDLFWHRDGVTQETLTTNFSWHAAAGVRMASERNLAGGMDFFMRSSDDESALAGELWSPVKEGQNAELAGRYVEVRAVVRANDDRDKSPRLTSLTQGYLVDPVRDFQLSLRALSANLARTVFEVKTIQLADEHNLLNIYQDLFETSDDIDPASTNIVRDALLPGIRQQDPGTLGQYRAKPFENRAYVPSYVLLVADDTGSVTYEVSRDGGLTWTLATPGEYTELTGNQGVSIVLRATLTGGAAVHRWALVL